MFTHLQLKSGYSFFNSTITIDKLMAHAKSCGVGALALTDEGVLYGAVEFYQTCQKEGIHPLLGLTVPVAIDAESTSLQVVLLAKNNVGYHQLMEISTSFNTSAETSIHLNNQYNCDELICIIPASTSLMGSYIKEEQFEAVEDIFTSFKRLFRRSDLFIGAAHRREDDTAFIDDVVAFGEAAGIRVVAMQDVCYLEEKDVVSYDCLQAMKHGEKWSSYQGSSGMEQRHFASEQEMKAKFSRWPQLITNISDIVKRCQVTFDFDRQLLPEFPVPECETASTYLRKLCENALREKFPHAAVEASERLTYELQVIEELGFSDYFLIVSDFVGFAKDNGIMTGPGRGSAAGSLVAYLLGITNVDPLKYGLLFERFLNPERVTMPDIDIDFSDVRREEIIDYVRGKYGTTHVAQIITFGTFLARSLLRELMKTMEIDYRDQAYILKHIPAQNNEGLLGIIRKSDSFADYIKQSDKLRQLFAIALKLEGLPRHMSTHAAGIVIGKQPLSDDVPLTKGAHDTYLTQYTMNYLEMIGLLKIDILGLRNLSMMERIVKTIEFQEKISVDPEQLPETNEKTFQLLRSGKTNGIFQLESDGMKRVLRRLQPSSMEDIVAVNALYRPGPMEQIQVYIDRKHARQKVTFLHPDLQPILAPTYGVLIYQEQIMQIAHQFAGLTLGEADILRRAISKKNRQLIEEQKSNFMNGCRKKGYPEQVAEEVFSWIYQFADYGFNKSHSVAYSKIAYQLSYLKANHPASFFAGFLSTSMNDPSKLPAYVKEASEMGIQVLPPSINESDAYFSVKNSHQIRIGLLAIKGIGYETAKVIVNERKNGYFTDLFDFCLRVNIKRNNMETLILAGVFDVFHGNRASLLASLDQAFARAELFGDIYLKGGLFTDEMKMAPSYADIEDFSLMQKLNDEKELMQLYVSNHPIQAYRKQLSLLDYGTLQQVKHARQHTKVHLIAVVERVKKIHTKRGESMAFLTVSDETNEMEVVVFPDLYRDVNPQLAEETIIRLEGKVSLREHEHQIIADKLMPVFIEEIVQQVPIHVYIKMTESKNEKAVLSFLQQTADKYPGKNRIILYNEEEKKTFRLSEAFRISNDTSVSEVLRDYFGNDNVVFAE